MTEQSFENHGKIVALVSFFCCAGFPDQLSMVAYIPAEAARHFFRGNLWSDSGPRPLVVLVLPGSAICAWRCRTGSFELEERLRYEQVLSAESAREVRRAGYRSNRIAAVCLRCGIAGTGAKKFWTKN